jgi:hypothetical protein
MAVPVGYAAFKDDITPDDYVSPYAAAPLNAPPGIIREGHGEEFDGFIAAGGYGEVYRITKLFLSRAYI